MRIARLLRTPEFFFKPSQGWRRLRMARHARAGVATLAWGLPIHVDPACLIARDILKFGVHERIVPEALCRLLAAGECALDVGAYLGQNTSILALVAGASGKVYAFEPHPRIVEMLRKNVELWSRYSLAPIEIVPKAVSSRVGPGSLYERTTFEENQGAASLLRLDPQGPERSVALTTLDASLPRHAQIGVAKLDVEGSELAVLRGAQALLDAGRIRDVVFEEFRRQPSPATRLLEDAGYHVFVLSASWSRPHLTPYRELAQARGPHDYLATLDPERARSRFQRPGWRCLRLRAARA